MLPSEIVNPYITLLYLWGFRAYKSPASCGLLFGSAKNSLYTVTTKVTSYQVIRQHYSNSLKVSSCNLNWFEITAQGPMELNNCQFLKPLVLLAALEQFVYQAQIGCYLLH